MIVNSSQGGGSKDTWVLEDGDDEQAAPPRIVDRAGPLLPDLRLDSWSAQQQQQQQQPQRQQQHQQQQPQRQQQRQQQHRQHQRQKHQPQEQPRQQQGRLHGGLG